MRSVSVSHQFLSKPCEAEALRCAVDRACGLDALLQAPALQEALGSVAELPTLPRVYKALTDALAHADAETLWSPGGPRWERPREAAPRAQRTPAVDGPGRRFLLPGDWEVRVGRNNVENDELTHRFAHADDVWLHASAVPGSHVVLP